MTQEKMKKIAESAMAGAKAVLAETGKFRPLVALFRAEGQQIADFPFPASLMDSTEGKDLLAAIVKKVAKQSGAEAVLFITDSWSLCVAKEQAKRIDADPEYRKEFDQACAKGVRAAAAAGFGEVKEAITVTVQTPLVALLISQPYERVGDRFEFGEQVIIDEAQGGMKGRMVFFEQAEGAVQ